MSDKGKEALTDRVSIALQTARRSVDCLLEALAYDAKIEGRDGPRVDAQIAAAKDADQRLLDVLWISEAESYDEEERRLEAEWNAEVRDEQER